MFVAHRSTFSAVAVACLATSGCLVSFEDYPLASRGYGGSGGLVAAGGSDAGASPSGGSSAGDSATAGTASAGSSAGGVSSVGSELSIDDFEDGDSQVTLIAGRNGSWFAANDGSLQAQQTPDPFTPCLPSLLVPPRGASERALHTSGFGFNAWGALVGVNFLATAMPAMPAMPYDISAYQGLTFAAKIGKTGAARQVRVAIRNHDTLYACTSCGDHFGMVATFGETFQTVSVPFASLKQQGWGKPLTPVFDATRAYAVTFTWAGHQTFDAWIDDLSFY